MNTGYRDTPEGQAFFAQSVPVTAAEYALNHQADGALSYVDLDDSKVGRWELV